MSSSRPHHHLPHACRSPRASRPARSAALGATRAVLLLALVTLQGCATQGRPEVVYLARHGQTEWNRVGRFQGDPDLDPVGYINRVSLWHLLKDEPLAAVYTSSLQRTRRTAELTARHHRLPIQPRKDLDEIHPGIMEGICVAQMAPHHARPNAKACVVGAHGSHPEVTLEMIREEFKAAERDGISGRFPQAESYMDVARRTALFDAELQRGYRERRVLVVGHGITNRTLLHHWMGWPLQAVARLRQENDQVYRLEFGSSGAPRLSLYTPGHGWKVCTTTPAPEMRYLDCNPNKGEPRYQPPAPPAPAASTPPPAASGEPASPATQPAPSPEGSAP